MNHASCYHDQEGLLRVLDAFICPDAGVQTTLHREVAAMACQEPPVLLALIGLHAAPSLNPLRRQAAAILARHLVRASPSSFFSSSSSSLGMSLGDLLPYLLFHGISAAGVGEGGLLGIATAVQETAATQRTCSALIAALLFASAEEPRRGETPTLQTPQTNRAENEHTGEIAKGDSFSLWVTFLEELRGRSRAAVRLGITSPAEALSLAAALAALLRRVLEEDEPQKNEKPNEENEIKETNETTKAKEGFWERHRAASAGAEDALGEILENVLRVLMRQLECFAAGNAQPGPDNMTVTGPFVRALREVLEVLRRRSEGGDFSPAAGGRGGGMSAERATRWTLLHRNVITLMIPELLTKGLQWGDKGGERVLTGGTALLGTLLDYLSARVVAAPEMDMNSCFEVVLPVVLRLWRTVSGALPESNDEEVEKAVMASLTFMEHAVGAAVHHPALQRALPDLLRGLVDLSMLPLEVRQLPSAAEPETGNAEDVFGLSIGRTRRCGRGNAEFEKEKLHPASVDEAKGLWGSGDDNSEGDDDDDDARESALGVGIDGLLPDNGARREAIACVLHAMATLSCDSAAVQSLPSRWMETCLFNPSAQLLTALSGHCGEVDYGLVEAALFACSEVLEEVLCDEALKGWGISCNASSSQFQTPPTFELPGSLAALANSATRLLGIFLRKPMGEGGGLSSQESGAAPFFVRIQVVRFVSRLVAGVAHVGCRNRRGAAAPHAALTEIVGPTTEGWLSDLITLLRQEQSGLVQVECLQGILDIALACFSSSFGAHSCMEKTQMDDSDSDEELSTEEESNDEGELHGVAEFNQCSPSAEGVALLSVVLSELVAIFPALASAPRARLYYVLGQLMGMAGAGGDPCHYFHEDVMQRTLEALARRYMELISSKWDGFLHREAAFVLNCLCDITASVGRLTRDALTWFTQVYSHSTQLYLSHNTESTTVGVEEGIDYEDACMLATDLLSNACDALLNRDALLLHVNTEAYTNAATNLSLLQTALMPGSGGDVGLQCLLILKKCQQSHATWNAEAVETGSGGCEDLTVNLRRACFALLYDCIYVHSPIDAPLAQELLNVCLSELMYAVGGHPHAAYARFEADSAASNAFLCLSELLHLCYDSDFMAPPQKAALAQLTGILLVALKSRGEGPAVSADAMQLNMVNTLSVLIAFQGSHACLPQQLSMDDIGSAICLISVMLQHFLPVRGHTSGKWFECLQVLRGLARIICHYLTGRGVEASSSTTDGSAVFLDPLVVDAVANGSAVAARCAQCINYKTSIQSLFGDWCPIVLWFMRTFPERKGSGNASRTLLESFLLKIQNGSD